MFHLRNSHVSLSLILVSSCLLCSNKVVCFRFSTVCGSWKGLDMVLVCLEGFLGF